MPLPLDPEAEAQLVDFADRHYEREFNTPLLRKVLVRKGLDEAQAKRIVKLMKRRRRGSVRRASLLKIGGGLGLLLLTGILLLATERLFWYIGLVGLVMLIMGVAEFITGVGRRPGMG